MEHQLGDGKGGPGAVARVALPGDANGKGGANSKAAVLKGMSHLATIKEAELTVSPNVVVDLGDHEKLELNVRSRRAGEQEEGSRSRREQRACCGARVGRVVRVATAS